MKVAFYGNVVNHFYQTAKALREHSEIDAHLYLDARHHPLSMPESDDPELKDNYPHWIHKHSYLTASSVLMPWRSALARELAQFDIIIVSTLGPIFAQFTNKPYCFFVTAGDSMITPFPIALQLRNIPLRIKLGRVIASFWQRQGIRRATEIWIQPFAPYVNGLKPLGIEQERMLPIYFPLIINMEKFKCDEKASDSQDENIRKIVNNYKFVLFHPSRILIKADPWLKAVGEWKQNELLFQGFAKFLQQSQSKDSVLVMIDSTLSPDLALAKEIIKDLGIEKNVLWIKPPRPMGFTHDELIQFYSIADVVADDFGIGWFGSIALETLSISRPLISYIDEQVMQRLYPWHPILSAKSPDEIARHLMDLYTNTEYKSKIGNQGRQWIEEFHSTHNASKIYVKRIKEVAERLEVEA
jgi:glycosyltransferase involved in cell wall biosynthesis